MLRTEPYRRLMHILSHSTDMSASSLPNIVFGPGRWDLGLSDDEDSVEEQSDSSRPLGLASPEKAELLSEFIAAFSLDQGSLSDEDSEDSESDEGNGVFWARAKEVTGGMIRFASR